MDKTKKKPVRKALGRGLSSLISTPAVTIAGSTAVYTPQLESTFSDSVALNDEDLTPEKKPLPEGLTFVDISKVENNAAQPRQDFKESELAELAASITRHGVLQPIIVRPLADGKYQIVAGERRWRAADRAGLKQLPVIIKDLSDEESYELSIIENVQRDDLNPVEEARAYQHLADRYSLTQQEIADRVGKDRSSITNMMRILKLPDEVIQLITDDKLTLGHAKAILAVKEPSVQRNLAKKVVEENLSVRKLEEIVSRVIVLGKDRRDSHKKIKQSSFPEITDRLRKALGTKVMISHHKTGKGKIEISYFSEEELERLVDLLCLD
ncbi:MAG: ParB/RepB/Spo0J family partition protein [Bdellovibrionota bacterium]|jgi:ParB family chromosome partitioning protein